MALSAGCSKTGKENPLSEQRIQNADQKAKFLTAENPGIWPEEKYDHVPI